MKVRAWFVLLDRAERVQVGRIAIIAAQAPLTEGDSRLAGDYCRAGPIVAAGTRLMAGGIRMMAGGTLDRDTPGHVRLAAFRETRPATKP